MELGARSALPSRVLGLTRLDNPARAITPAGLRKGCGLGLVAIGISLAGVLRSQGGVAQGPAASAEAPKQVFRVTASLVQVDVVVTDKDEHQVTDLRPEDFEIREDGRRREIVNFARVSRPEVERTPPPAAPGTPTRREAPVPTEREEARTLAFVVDDLSLSMEDLASVRRTLLRFVDEQMEPGDRAAILLSGSGVGALQQFTSDKRLLREAADRVRFNAYRTAVEGGTGNRVAQEALRSEQPRSTGTLGALDFILRGLGAVPGRKALVLFSSGLPVASAAHGFDVPLPEVQSWLSRIVERANRASVVIYAIDARGLDAFAPAADENTRSLVPGPLGVSLPLVERRRGSQNDLQGLQRLAADTGGLLVFNTNELSRGVARALEDQQGYYLLGYAPDSDALARGKHRARLHKLSVRVKRPGLRVRSRAGYYDAPDRETPPEPASAAARLNAALLSPFNAGDLRLRLTLLFDSDPKVGPFLRAIVHIDGHDLTFTPAEEGWNTAALDVLAVTFGSEGQAVDQKGQTYALRLRSGHDRELDAGFIYFLDLPVKRPGSYQFRIAVRDMTSNHLGSLSQFVEVPDLGKGQLALSGILLASHAPPSVVEPVGDGAMQPAKPGAVAAAALRRVSRGSVLDYTFDVFNARLDRATGAAKVLSQVRVFREAREVYTGPVKTLASAPEAEWKRLPAGGSLQLRETMEPGEYVLEVSVTDALDGKAPRTVRQWLAFEVGP